MRGRAFAAQWLFKRAPLLQHQFSSGHRPVRAAQLPEVEPPGECGTVKYKARRARGYDSAAHFSALYIVKREIEILTEGVRQAHGDVLLCGIGKDADRLGRHRIVKDSGSAVAAAGHSVFGYEHIPVAPLLPQGIPGNVEFAGKGTAYVDVAVGIAGEFCAPSGPLPVPCRLMALFTLPFKSYQIRDGSELPKLISV